MFHSLLSVTADVNHAGIVFTGLVVVFLTLFALIIFIKIMGLIMTSISKIAKKPAQVDAVSAGDEQASDEFVAAVTAAINRVNPVPQGRQIKIKSIRKV